jgi:hypothetical protein
VAYNIRTRFGDQLNKVDFKVDRYELDRSQTYLWDPETQTWLSPDGTAPASTTFDGHTQYQYQDNIFTLGTNGQVIQVNAYTADGATEDWGFQAQSGAGRLVVTVNGTTIPYWRSGLSGPCWQINYSQGRPLNNIREWSTLDSWGTDSTVTTAGSYYISRRDVPAGISISNAFYWQAIDPPNSVIIRSVPTGSATPAVFSGSPLSSNAAVRISQMDNIYVLDENSTVSVPTVFDSGSTTFVTPAVQSTGDEYDRYLLFPKINIIDPTPTIPGPPPPPPNPVVSWRNVRLGTVTWTNDTGNAVVWLNTYA